MYGVMDGDGLSGITVVVIVTGAGEKDVSKKG